LLRRIAHAQPGGERQQAEAAASATKTTRHEVSVTAHASGRGGHRAEVAGEHRHAGQGGEALGANHTAETFSTAMKATDTPTPTSVRPTAAISHARGQREQQRARRGDRRSGGEYPARAEGVGQHADRDLQQRVDVEVGGGQRAEHCRTIEKACASSPAIAAGAVRWTNDSTKLASASAEDHPRPRQTAPGRSAVSAVARCSCASESNGQTGTDSGTVVPISTAPSPPDSAGTAWRTAPRRRSPNCLGALP